MNWPLLWREKLLLFFLFPKKREKRERERERKKKRERERKKMKVEVGLRRTAAATRPLATTTTGRGARGVRETASAVLPLSPRRGKRSAPLLSRRTILLKAAKDEDQQQQQEKEDKSGNIKQLLGMKDASVEKEDKWKVRLQLMKPVTWVPLIWGVACGAAASGAYTWNIENIAKALLCMTMSGPLLTGYTQVINDYYDREIDAINEPYRPIPSGLISETEAVIQFVLLLAGGLGVAYVLDLWAGHDQPVIFYEAIFGSFISYIYSAPPLKLKQEGWVGSYALGASYIALPWWAGQLLFGNNLTWDVALLTVLYSLAGLGIAIVNDFKSIEGDRELGLKSLPVEFGIDTAKWITVGTIDLTQLAVAAYVYQGLGERWYSIAIQLLLIPQVFFQFKYFIPDPVKNDVKYQGAAQPFLVLGILMTGLAVGHHNQILAGL